MKGEWVSDHLEIALEGRIDSNNAPAVEKEIFEMAARKEGSPVVLDADGLDYISSAGLRILLHLKKTNPELSIINVHSEVFEILEMTGFTEMMTVEKAYRRVSIEGCEEIGRGSNGILYRIDQDTVVKVYNNTNALADIRHEREVARLALILGIPTAISYDVVRVGNSYGSVFELLNASSFSRILANEPEKMDWCVKEYVRLLKKIHGTVVPQGKLPDMRETVREWAGIVAGYLPEEAGRKLVSLVEAIPKDDHMIHGDYHTNNVELQNGEVLLIDMDTLSVGHPIFELAFMFNAFIGFSERDHNVILSFQGFDFETSQTFWRKTLEEYLGTTNEKKILEVENKARVIGYVRLFRRIIRLGQQDTPEGRESLRFWAERLAELLKTTDTLVFSLDELEVEATTENLPHVLSFIEQHLEQADCPPRAEMQITVAAEEIFVNIANYAYAPEKGMAKVRVELSDDPAAVTITFIDQGIPYDPLAKDDPDVTLPASERQIGGLGIYLAKKTMDSITYEYKDGQNILKLIKNL